jgi:hypothetical protein
MSLKNILINGCDIKYTPVTGTVLCGSKEKSPALAFSLSLLFWGSGHFYIGQKKIGILFLLIMINFYAFIGIALIYKETVRASLELFYINFSEAFLICGAIYASGLIICFFNALHAYYGAIRIRSRTFKGTDSFLLPPICSFLIPGWGQFLNGQMKKGIFFQIAAAAELITFPAILFLYHFWPGSGSSAERLFLEQILIMCITLLPFILIMWIYSIFDAGRVCMNDNKKQFLLNRIDRFRCRVAMRGWVECIAPLAKRMTVLCLFLLCTVILSYNYLPEKYYLNRLQKLQINLSQKEMAVIPALINRLIQSINGERIKE